VPPPPGAPPAVVAAFNNNIRADCVLSLGSPADHHIIFCDTTITAGVIIQAAIPPPNSAAIAHPSANLVSQTGFSAGRAQADKVTIYNNNWDFPPNASFLAPAFEVHGAASSHTHAYIERVARAVFPGVGGNGSDFGGRRAAFKSLARQRISVALQTANARAIHRWRRLCWSTAAPVGAAAAPA